MRRAYTATMREISGFGGSYEAGCRAMVLAGLDWLDAHPTADPKFRGYRDVFGLIMEDNEDARALTAAMMAATIEDDGRIVRCGEEATGAMHHAAVLHILHIRAAGWDKYVEEMGGPGG